MPGPRTDNIHIVDACLFPSSTVLGMSVVSIGSPPRASAVRCSPIASSAAKAVPGRCDLAVSDQRWRGWGDPLDRDPERVELDVRDGYTSIAGAEREFGAVITGDPHWDPEGLRVDESATAARRAAARSAR
jgi:hypothetical protein